MWPRLSFSDLAGILKPGLKRCFTLLIRVQPIMLLGAEFCRPELATQPPPALVNCIKGSKGLKSHGVTLATVEILNIPC